MRAIVLGSAAGGGVPQWNSAGEACRLARRGETVSRTQCSIAVSADDRFWLLLNASPDLRQQIERTRELHPRSPTRDSPIVAVVLTGGEVDAIAGLLSLRERQPLAIVATRRTHAILDANPIFEVLSRDIVTRRPACLDGAVVIDGLDREPIGLTVTLFAVAGKTPLHAERGVEAVTIEEGETTVGCAVSDGVSTMFFVPGCAAMTPSLARRLRDADTVLFDGTLAEDDEMIRGGLGRRTGRRMGHMSVFGADGTIAAFASLNVRRRILIHLNNSNPVLIESSPERAAVLAAGWEIAEDGMEIAW